MQTNVSSNHWTRDGVHHTGQHMGRNDKYTVDAHTHPGGQKPEYLVITHSCMGRTNEHLCLCQCLCALLSRHSHGSGWSSDGCSVISVGSSDTSCLCNHTTNFAVLMNYLESKVTAHLLTGGKYLLLYVKHPQLKLENQRQTFYCCIKNIQSDLSYSEFHGINTW